MNTLTIYYGAARSMRATGCNQCRMLEFAEKYRGWHTYAKDRATMRALDALVKKGYLEVQGDLFQFTYPKQTGA